MSYSKGSIEKPAKPVVYRTRHKKLKDLKVEDTTHGFMERIKQQFPIPASESIPQPAFCGVLGNEISDSIQMTTNNYRRVPRELQNRVRRGRAVVAPQNAANTSTASSNRLTCPPSDHHLESQRRSCLLTEHYHHAARFPLTIGDTQEVDYEEEYLPEHLADQDQVYSRYPHVFGAEINDYYAQTRVSFDSEDSVPFRTCHPVIAGYSYQAPAGPSPDASFNPYSLPQSAPSLLTSTVIPWGANVEDPVCSSSALH